MTITEQPTKQDQFEVFFREVMTNEDGDELTISEFQKKLATCENRINLTQNAINELLKVGDMKIALVKQKYLTWSWRFWKQCTVRNILQGNNSRALKSFEMYKSNHEDARLHSLKMKQEA